uniref:Uncharacterized protein n=1 Tax=Lepeophtheirus salmonis TaxID=72036 RepID=A0A0K2VJK1_LEPSM
MKCILPRNLEEFMALRIVQEFCFIGNLDVLFRENICIYESPSTCCSNKLIYFYMNIQGVHLLPYT